ncbi:50S ribosome-binding GTPase [Fragilaria crotonensis]|nr:50S ribosome-binding GTPase [Fragilaria crotonensis]
MTSDENKERVKHRALSLGSIASRHFFEGEPSYAVQACQLLAEVGPVVRSAGLTADDVPMPWLASFKVLHSARGEAVFIGRSNVGKSSLVNMITNRKSLAYISKTPGKTQQFNFFAVNDKPEREREIKYGDVVPGEKDRDSFYLVDLPGFGFAKVPEKQRQEWSRFMTEYIATRKTLKVVFHLVDSRHGPTAEDARIMKEIGQILPKRVTYVVVLTKADKNVKGVTKKNEGKVAREVMDSLRQTMKEYQLSKAPVILTSAETKLGRDDLWRYLKLAAEA